MPTAPTDAGRDAPAAQRRSTLPAWLRSPAAAGSRRRQPAAPVRSGRGRRPSASAPARSVAVRARAPCSAARWCTGCCNPCPTSRRERRRDAATRIPRPQRRRLDRGRPRGAGGERAGPDRRPAFRAGVCAPAAAPRSRSSGGWSGRDRPPALVSGQIDRLVVTPDEVLIVDYKTNHAPPATGGRSACRPMSASSRSTARCCAKLYPERPVRAALLWTETPELMEISAPALDARTGRPSSRREPSLTRQGRVHRLAL